MADAAGADAVEAVALLREVTGEPYALVGRLSGGETGAHEVVSGASGVHYVLKWERAGRSQRLRADAVAFSERLRTEAAWPVPEQTAVAGGGCLFVLQQFMPGAAVEEIGHPMVDQVLDLHERRLRLARKGNPSRWAAQLIDTLTVGGEGYCRHESLRTYGPRSARLVAAIEKFGEALDPADLPGFDIVHWDFHPGNLLGADGGLTAIVDTDFALVGDASFDLVTLAVTSRAVRCDPGVRDRLWRAAFDGLDEVRTRAYLGHLFVRLIDWPIRRDRPEEAEFWLHLADQMLPL